jgi:hypothetical protein
VRPHQIEGLDLLADELVGPVEHLLVFGVGLEIPCHCGSPVSAHRFQEAGPVAEQGPVDDLQPGSPGVDVIGEGRRPIASRPRLEGETG